jgi:APA family basic amino acid/polyamine antiporter
MEEPKLKRSLGLSAGIFLVAGLMIGTGVFKKISPMAASGIGGPWIMLAWIIAGCITLLGAFTYAGLSLLTTETGGVYEYLRLSFGKFLSFLYGWTVFMMIGSGSIAALGFVFFQSLASLVPLPDLAIKAFASLLILLLTGLNSLGVKKGSDLNIAVTVVKITGILVLVVAGLFYARGHPVQPQIHAIPPLGGFALFSGLFGAMLSALYAYDGWANLTFITGEIKNPQRNIALAIIAGVGLVMLFYVLLNWTYMRVMPLSVLGKLDDNAIAGTVVAQQLFGRSGTVTMALLIMVSGFGSLNACIIVFSRVYYRMAVENVFFPQAAKVHPRFRTPFGALYISAAWCIILVIFGSFEVISNMVIFSGYLFFGLASWGLIRMKRKQVIRAKVIAYPAAPVIIILFCLTLTIITIIRQPLTALTSIALIACGMPFYFYFSKPNHRE